MDYDTEIEQHYHPENFEPEYEYSTDDFNNLMETEDLCPACHSYLYTGYRGSSNDPEYYYQFWICKACDYLIEQ